MSVLDDIMKKRNPLSSQGVATQVAQPSTATQSAVNNGAAVTQVAQPSTATQSAVNNGAAVTQMPKTGFNAEIAKVAQNVVDNMKQQPVQPNTAVPTPAPAPAAQPQKLSYVDMLNKMYTPETAEERAKRERKEKWDKTSAAIGDGISALSNLYFTTQGAPNSYDGKNSMSERTRQLYEKLDKDRKENERWYLNLYMNAAKMDADEAKAERSWKNTLEMQKQAQENADRNFEAQEKQSKWQREEAERQANEKNKQFWASHNLSVKNYNRQLDKENPTISFSLGNGQKANIKKQDINPQNVSFVYNKLPKEIREQYAQEPVFDSYGIPVITTDENGNRVPVTKARKLNENDMMVIIGEHIANYPDVQNAWKEVGGEIPTSTQQSGGGGKHSHRVGGNKSGKTDV